MSSRRPDSAFPGLENLNMSAFVDTSNIHPSLKHAGFDDMSKECNSNDQGGDSEEDELLTVHFGNATTACNTEIIDVDSEEESSESTFFLCSVCAEVCENLHSLKQHEMTHLKEARTAYPQAEIDPDIMFVCSVCTVVCKDLNSLKQHEMTHLKESRTTYTQAEMDPDIMFVCSVCTVVCKDLNSLKQHEMTHSKGTHMTYNGGTMDQDILFVCSVCNVVCENLQSLRQHEMTHSEEVATTYSEDPDTTSGVQGIENNMFVCSVCNMICNSLSSLKRHETTHLEGICTSYSGGQNTHISEAKNNKNKMFICGVCGLACENSVSLMCHEVTHLEDAHLAYSEPTGFLSEDEIIRNNMFVCSVCFLVFSDVQSLIRHEIVHSDQRPYKCSFCNYAGKLKENLLTHMNTHTREKVFKCQYCDYTSIKSHSLKLHQQFHTDIYPHKCSLCLYSTATIGSLSSHYRNHHHTSAKNLASSKSSNDKCSPVLNSGAYDEEKIHRCHLCDYSSKKPCSLKRHLQQHTDQLPNKCHLCLYSTANAGNLTSHYKNHHLNNAENQIISAEEREPSQANHSEDDCEIYLEEPSPNMEKPYKCPYCEYSATKPSRIRDHLQHHTDSFPNKCHLCLYSTTRAGNLLYHYRYHHYSNAEAMARAAELALSASPVVHKHKQMPDLGSPSLVPEKLYKCDLCEYTAARPHRIKEHAIFHNYNYANKCRLCVYSTVCLGNLTTHYRKHHQSITKGKNNIENLVHREADRRSCLRNLTVKLERIPELTNYFVCNVCQKIFKNKSVLTEHLKTHLEIYKYKCDVCESSFCESELLEIHKKSHLKEEVKQPTSSSDMRDNDLLCKIKLTSVKSYPMRSVLKKARLLRSKLQLKKRQSLRDTNSLHITTDKLQQHCKLVLHKLDTSNSLSKEIHSQSGITNTNKGESSIGLSKNNKDKQALQIPRRSVLNATEAIQHDGKRWALKDCVVKIANTNPEVLSKLQLHKCSLCEFAGTSSDSLKIHIDSHHKEEAGLKSHREFNQTKERSLKSHNEYDHRAGMSLTMNNGSNLKEKTNLRPNTSNGREELSLTLNTGSKQKMKYSCSRCSYTCRRIQDFKEHLVEHSSTERSNSGFDEEAESSAELHYACAMCSFSCDQLALFHQHLSKHDEERKLRRCLPGNKKEIASSSKKTVFYTCLLCNRKSSDVESMTKHMLTCNTKKGLW